MPSDDRPVATTTDNADIVRHMHDTAGKYYLHFSTVRTTATSLVTPIGILASVSLLVYCQKPASMFAIYFLIFIIATTLFAVWSAASRSIERKYEEQLRSPGRFDPGTEGFRHIFRDYCKPGEGFDVFTIGVIIFGLIYLGLYWWQYSDVCM
jgi:hypothetical protein